MCIATMKSMWYFKENTFIKVVYKTEAKMQC
jgi:hypothetical protein